MFFYLQQNAHSDKFIIEICNTRRTLRTRIASQEYAPVVNILMRYWKFPTDYTAQAKLRSTLYHVATLIGDLRETSMWLLLVYEV